MADSSIHELATYRLSSSDPMRITLTVNGKQREMEITPWTTLIDALRERLHLTGTKKGCDHGQCGACTVLGAWARGGGTVLILFLIPTTLIFHDFWMYEAQQQQTQMINFMKNLAIMGGLFYLVGFGAGAISIDAKSSHQEKKGTFKQQNRFM